MWRLSVCDWSLPKSKKQKIVILNNKYSYCWTKINNSDLFLLYFRTLSYCKRHKGWRNDHCIVSKEKPDVTFVYKTTTKLSKSQSNSTSVQPQFRHRLRVPLPLQFQSGDMITHCSTRTASLWGGPENVLEEGRISFQISAFPFSWWCLGPSSVNC